MQCGISRVLGPHGLGLGRFMCVGMAELRSDGAVRCVAAREGAMMLEWVVMGSWSRLGDVACQKIHRDV